MNILLVTSSYLPTINGVTYHISSITHALRKMGHKVYILAPSFPGYKDNDKHVIRYPSIPNPLVKNYPLGGPFASVKKIKRLKIDVIHTHHPLVAGQLAWQIAKKLNKPLFFTAHTQYEQYLNYYFPYGYEFASNLLNKDLIRMSGYSRKIICPSTNTQKRLNRIGIKNTAVIYNGVEDYFFVKPSRKSLITPTLVYTGRVDKEKRPLELIKIARELKKIMPNFRLLVLGSGSQLQKMREQTTKAKLDDHVMYLGVVDRKLFPDIYKSVHLFITPSLSEVMPISILEAMASGVPTISIKGSGLEEIVIDGKTGYLCEKNSGKIAEKIKEILSDPKAYSSLSKKTYAFAMNFSANNTARKLLDLYLEQK
jgi:glycosyltransferase involved in cell wall biosynthesis